MDEGPQRPDGVGKPAADATVGLVEERARLQADTDGGRGQPAPPAPRRGGRPRRLATALLVVVTSLVVTVAVAGVWAQRNALDTDRWVRTVGPVVEDPAVQAALGNWITSELMGVVDTEEFFERALPERGQVLAVPLSNAVQGFVDDQVEAFLASDAFQRLWVEANRLAHERAVAVLEGDAGDNLPIVDGKVVLNLVSVLNEVLAEIGEASPEILGRTVDMPTITVDEVPDEAIQKLEDALGRDIPEDFGQFVVFDASRLRQVQDAVDLLNRLVVVTVVAAGVLLVLTHWLAPRRRRTLLQLTVGITLGLAVVRQIGARLGDRVVDFARPENRDAVRVVVNAFISTLQDVTGVVLGVVALVAAVAVLTGPYPWARALRRWTVSLARASVALGGVAARRPRDPTTAWVARHREALHIGGLVVAIVTLLVVDLSWLDLALLALALGGFELVVWRIGRRGPAVDEPPAASVPEGGVPGDSPVVESL